MTPAPLIAPEVVAWLRQTFSPDGRCDEEHEAWGGGLGFGLLHYALVRHLQPSRVLAIGSRTGFIPACLAMAVRDNGAGLLDFVDANYSKDQHGNAAWDGQGWWTDHTFGPLDSVVVMRLMRTDDYFASVPVEPLWGYVHVDGGHDYETAKHDFDQAAARLTPGGIIALHDSHARKVRGVRRLVNELPSEWQRWEYPGTWGLTLVQRR